MTWHEKKFDKKNLGYATMKCNSLCSPSVYVDNIIPKTLDLYHHSLTIISDQGH